MDLAQVIASQGDRIGKALAQRRQQQALQNDMSTLAQSILPQSKRAVDRRVERMMEQEGEGMGRKVSEGEFVPVGATEDTIKGARGQAKQEAKGHVLTDLQRAMERMQTPEGAQTAQTMFMKQLEKEEGQTRHLANVTEDGNQYAVFGDPNQPDSLQKKKIGEGEEQKTQLWDDKKKKVVQVPQSKVDKLLETDRYFAEKPTMLEEGMVFRNKETGKEQQVTTERQFRQLMDNDKWEQVKSGRGDSDYEPTTLYKDGRQKVARTKEEEEQLRSEGWGSRHTNLTRKDLQKRIQKLQDERRDLRSRPPEDFGGEDARQKQIDNINAEIEETKQMLQGGGTGDAKGNGGTGGNSGTGAGSNGRQEEMSEEDKKVNEQLQDIMGRHEDAFDSVEEAQQYEQDILAPYLAGNRSWEDTTKSFRNAGLNNKQISLLLEDAQFGVDNYSRLPDQAKEQMDKSGVEPGKAKNRLDKAFKSMGSQPTFGGENQNKPDKMRGMPTGQQNTLERKGGKKIIDQTLQGKMSVDKAMRTLQKEYGWTAGELEDYALSNPDFASLLDED